MRRKRLGAVLAVAAVAVGLSIPASPASGASPKQECEAAGGTWIQNPPDNGCFFPGDPPGNNQGGVVKDESLTTDRGKSDPHEDSTTCQVVNNGGSHNCD
jgi:hypothetical protein